ncbi:MAG: YHS domain-containing protein [Candidatus Heimdallarchaeota archaeon]|jgi:YHS domain-containing protein|nr:YHS domain-containing protein [Candidatus Heimdallarchaeota archaeon]MCK4254879.1 YHS domain-containing protein [Candidatus Heimdallarchaeota archaeon]
MNLTTDRGKHTCCVADLPNKEVSATYKGKKLYFCDKPCLKEFKKDPERFLSSTHFRLEFKNLEDA